MDTPNPTPSPEEPAHADELEQQTNLLRREAEEKLQQAKEKLHQAKQDLESVSADVPTPKRNPFGRMRESLRQKATELQSSQMPMLPKSSRGGLSHLSAPVPPSDDDASNPKT